jgi:hypothetical protein
MSSGVSIPVLPKQRSAACPEAQYDVLLHGTKEPSFARLRQATSVAGANFLACLASQMARQKVSG